MSTDVFWGEISPCEHMVQFYESDGVFLETLETFVCGGLTTGEAVIIIATTSHLAAIANRLSSRGIDLDHAGEQGQYIPIDAEAVLDKFMIGKWPDDDLFHEFVNDLLARAKQGERRVRAFGELVAVLWDRGCSGATLRLEHLWHNLCREKSFSLFCAYPRVGFTQDAEASIREICALHSRLIKG